MRGRVRSLLVLLVLVGALLRLGPDAAAGTKTIDGDPSDWIGGSTQLGGTSRYSAGEFVHQDYIYDDYGANTGQRAPQHGSTSSSQTVGDYRYPSDQTVWGHNAADIRELRFAADAAYLYVLLLLNTFKEEDSTVLGLAIDNDPDASPAEGAWPYEAGIKTPGTDVVITLWGTGGAVTPIGGASTELNEDEVAADTEANAIEARIPRSLVGGDQWKVQAATGLSDVNSWAEILPTQPSTTQPGYGRPDIPARAFNVAFRNFDADLGRGDTGTYFEAAQAAALASGNLSKFVAKLDVDKLVTGADDPLAPIPSGLHEVVMKQSFTVHELVLDEQGDAEIVDKEEGHAYGDDSVHGRSEGIGGAALEQTFSFYGPYQPYALYIPAASNGAPLPAALILHGHGGAHCGFQCSNNFLSQMGDGPQGPMLLVSPLGRGSSMYADYGEQDVLEVLDDAATRVAVDPERVYVAGYSMGGYGAFRFASLYPDRFARAAAWAGYTGEFTGRYLYDGSRLRDEPFLAGDRDRNMNGDHVLTVENLEHIPMLQLAGTNDEILPVTGQYAAAARMDDLGLRNRFDLYPGYEHLTFGVLDDWEVVREWFGTETRTTSPRRVVYSFSDSMIDSRRTDLYLQHGRAYWVEALDLRDSSLTSASLLGKIEATSMALPGDTHQTTPINEPSTDPTPNIRTGIDWTNFVPETTKNALDVSLENLELARFSAPGAALDTKELLTIKVTTDGEATLEISGDFRGVTVTVTGATATWSSEKLVIALPAAGEYTIFVRPCAWPGPGAIPGQIPDGCPPGLRP